MDLLLTSPRSQLLLPPGRRADWEVTIERRGPADRRLQLNLVCDRPALATLLDWKLPTPPVGPGRHRLRIPIRSRAEAVPGSVMLSLSAVEVGGDEPGLATLTLRLEIVPRPSLARRADRLVWVAYALLGLLCLGFWWWTSPSRQDPAWAVATGFDPANNTRRWADLMVGSEVMRFWRLATPGGDLYVAAAECPQVLRRAVLGSDDSTVVGDALPATGWDRTTLDRFLDRLRERGIPARLPTCEEWEFAARAGATTPYLFADGLLPDRAVYDLEARSGRPEAAGRHPANAFGLYHVHGNVWEVARQGPDLVVRGGGWASRPEDCQLGLSKPFAELPPAQVGLRLVIDVPGGRP